MKVKKCNIDVHEFEIVLVDIEKDDSENCMIPLMRKYNRDEDEIEQMQNLIKTKAKGGGVTYVKDRLSNILIVIFPYRNEKERLGLLYMKYIMQNSYILVCDLDSEEVIDAYLMQCIFKKIY